MTIPLQDWVRMSWSSCRSETETYSGRFIYDKESDRWKIDKWKLLLSKKFANSAIYLFYIARSLIPRRLWHRKLICYSIHLSLTIPLSPSLSLCFYLSLNLSLYFSLTLYLSLSLSVSLTVILHLSTYLFFYLFHLSLSLSLSLYLSILLRLSTKQTICLTPAPE